MDSNRIKGVWKQIMGGVKQSVGRLTGNRATVARGKSEQVVGKAQSAYGNVKDNVRSAFRK